MIKKYTFICFCLGIILNAFSMESDDPNYLLKINFITQSLKDGLPIDPNNLHFNSNQYLETDNETDNNSLNIEEDINIETDNSSRPRKRRKITTLMESNDPNHKKFSVKCRDSECSYITHSKRKYDLLNNLLLHT